MDGNMPIVQMFDLDDLPVSSFTSMDTQTLVVALSLPSLDAGFRHLCRNDGSPILVYKVSDGVWELK